MEHKEIGIKFDFQALYLSLYVHYELTDDLNKLLHNNSVE
jgi:hypothetical protein